jgi:predicted DNA-binding transcriptional regulator AlpA
MTLLTIDQCCDLLQISRMQFWRFEKANIVVPAKIVGKRKRYNREEILKAKLYLK